VVDNKVFENTELKEKNFLNVQSYMLIYELWDRQEEDVGGNCSAWHFYKRIQ